MKQFDKREKNEEKLMTKVSVIGSISMDLVTRTNRVPNAGETVFGEDFAMVHGGKGANQAVAFADFLLMK